MFCSRHRHRHQDWLEEVAFDLWLGKLAKMDAVREVGWVMHTSRPEQDTLALWTGVVVRVTLVVRVGGCQCLLGVLSVLPFDPRAFA